MNRRIRDCNKYYTDNDIVIIILYYTLLSYFVVSYVTEKLDSFHELCTAVKTIRRN